MLAHNWHRRLANKLSPTRWENRFLRFANDDDQGNPLEQNPEQEPETLEQTPHELSDIANISAGLRGDIEQIRPLVAQNVLRSAFILETGISLMEQAAKQGNADPNIASIITKGNRYLEGKENGEDVAALENELTEDIVHMLHKPEFAQALTTAFEKRMEYLHQLKQRIGDVPPAKFVELETHLKLDSNTDKLANMVSEPDIWTDEEVDQAFAIIGIELNEYEPPNAEGLSPEQLKAFDSVNSQFKINAKRKLTKQEKVQLLHDKMTAARKIAIMELHDTGEQTTLQDTSELEKKLFEQLLQARNNLKEAMSTRASSMRKKLKAFAETYGQKAGGESVAVLAQYFGVSESELSERILDIDATLQQATGALRKPGNTGDIAGDGNLPDVTGSEFTTVASTINQKLTELQWLESDDENTIREGLLGSLTKRKQEAETWVQSRRSRLKDAYEFIVSDAGLRAALTTALGFGTEQETLKELENLKRHNDMADRLEEGGATAEDKEHLYEDLSPEKRQRLDQLIHATENSGFLALLVNDKQELSKTNLQNSEAERDSLFEEYDALVGNLTNHPLLQHETCQALDITGQLTDYATELNGDLQLLAQMKGPRGNEQIAQCKLRLKKMRSTVEELNALQGVMADSPRVRSIPPERISEYQAVARTTETVACYNQTDGCIYINESKVRNSEHREAALHHEQGHAIVDTLAHRTGVLPMLFAAVHDTLAQPIPGDAEGRTFDDLLMERAEAWHVQKLYTPIYEQELARLRNEDGVNPANTEGLAQRRTNAKLKELMMDELVNKYATWKHSGKSSDGFAPEDIALFSLLEQGPSQAPISFDTEALSNAAQPIALQMSEEELLAGAGDADGEGSGEGGGDKLSTIGSDIMDIQNKFLQIHEFMKAHQHVDGMGEFSAWVNDWESAFQNKVKQPFYNPSSENPVSEDKLERMIVAIKNDFLTDAEKQVDKVQKEQMDATENAASQKSLWQSLRSYRLVNIMDVIKTFQAMGEDIQRMWKRRSETAQAMIGTNLTSWIGDSIPYAGQLKHEFQRRGSASEIEEVKQWKDALEDIDSYGLADMLATSRNKDQVRGIVELLVDRGRLDMNDKRFWETLKDLSGLPMPIEACRDDSVLRDKWLQKMVTEVWGDKDKFYEWRQSNDSGIDSGKNKFQQVADQLSNINGGLASALERQLKLYQQGKESGTMPDEVNPHLYEKILHYAMSNGKMSMEQKMFYLVQGARFGIISIDRIQALAGENGGVLNQFPMIDYFTGSNNTTPEYEAIGQRIEESGNPFKPGEKTTIWIHSEVLRNESARQRMSKAMSGARTEALDHEDVPTLAAIMDYKNVEEITGVLSGSRFKISYEAAKNFYTGTGKGLLLKARKAQLAEQGIGRFTEQDAAEAAKTIVTHLHYDNIVTGNANDKKPRIEVTLDQMATQQGPSTGGMVVQKFRDPLHALARDALQQANVGFGSGNLKDVQSIDQYMRSPSENSSNSIIYDENRKLANFAATGEVEKQLKAAFMADPGMAQRILASYAGRLKAEGGDTISEATVREYIGKMQNHEVSRR